VPLCTYTTRAHAAFLIQRADIAREPQRRFLHRALVVERLAADDARAALRVERDQFEARLDIARDVPQRREPAPRDDLLDVVRLIEPRLERLVAALPVRDAQVARERMIGRHVHHRARDGERGERIVRRRLDDRVAAQDHVAQNRDER
jgi:hypothetical protein